MTTSLRLFICFSFAICFGQSTFLAAEINGNDIVITNKTVDASDSTVSEPEKSFIFFILRHVKKEEHHKLWKRCYQSIREFYPDHSIVIIDDHSTIPITEEPLNNTIVIQSEYPGAGELLPYYYFLSHEWADKLIFLHDSMLLQRPFTKEELNAPVKFHWHFERYWYNENQVINSLLSHLNDSEELININVNKKESWYGCFGSAMMIDYDVLRGIEDKYRLTEALKSVINNGVQRAGLERVLGILLFKERYVTKENCSNFGSIFTSYPEPYSSLGDDKLNQIKKTYSGAVLKTWVGR